jgi:hypothetical protein
MVVERGVHDLLNALDMRRVLRMSKGQWKGSRQRGLIIPPFTHIGRSPRWRWFEVQDWIARGCPAPSEPTPKPAARKKGTDPKENI